MMLTLENEILKVVVSNIGGELKSVYGKLTQIEYIWSGNTGVYRKSAPNLFPFIGNIKNDSVEYLYKEKKLILPMMKHGFAKDMNFELKNYDRNNLSFELKNSEKTKELYPFDFSFKINYYLTKNELIQEYIVENLDSETMFFHVGAHTAFNYSFQDSYLVFKDESCLAYNMDICGKYLSKIEEELHFKEKNFYTKKDFSENAFVLKKLENRKVHLKNIKDNHSVEVDFEDFPILTLWSPQDDSSFVCIEPWAGITDFSDNTSNVEKKYHINQIAPGEVRKFKQRFIFR